MKNELGTQEKVLLDLLVRNRGVSEIEALVFVLMITKQVARSITVPRLIEIIKLYHYYDQLPSESEIGAAIQGLIDKSMLSLVRAEHEERVSCPDPANAMRQTWNVGRVAELEQAISIVEQKLLALERGVINILGPATEPEVQRAFFLALDEAREEIKLPVFSTRSHGRLRDALERAISRGVQIKLLMYSPKAASLTYGHDYDKELVMMTTLWRQEMKDMNKRSQARNGRIQVRMIQDLNHLHFSGGLIVDHNLFRYGVRYPDFQWGHEAIIITGQRSDGSASNLLMLLEHYFDLAWSHATPLSRAEHILHVASFRKWPR